MSIEVSAHLETEDLGVILSALVAHRRAAGLKQSDIAERLKVKQPVISDIERNRGGAGVKLTTVQRYAEALGATVSVRLVLPIVEASDE